MAGYMEVDGEDVNCMCELCDRYGWHDSPMALKEKAIVALLWDYLKKDPEHKDRRQTGWGTKSKMGLAACIERINKIGF